MCSISLNQALAVKEQAPEQMMTPSSSLKPVCATTSPQSTSAGSSPSTGSASPPTTPAEEIPPAYLAPFFAQNTFLHAAVDRSASLDGFFSDRMVRSCPVSMDEEGCAATLAGIALPPGLGAPPGLNSAPHDTTGTSPTTTWPAASMNVPTWPATMDEEELGLLLWGQQALEMQSQFWPPTIEDEEQLAAILASGMLGDTTTTAAAVAPPAAPMPSVLSPKLHHHMPAAMPGMQAHAAPHILDLSAALAAQEHHKATHTTMAPRRGGGGKVGGAGGAAMMQQGMLDLHTLGSAEHFIGTCKPCAFFYTKGCASGAQCVFCHLCPAGEKKRRQKDKRQYVGGVAFFGQAA